MTEPKKILSAKAMLKMLEARVDAAKEDVVAKARLFTDDLAVKGLDEGPDGLTMESVAIAVQKLRDAEALVAAAKGGA